MQQFSTPPGASLRTSKNRYRTPLPFSVPYPEEIAQQRRRPKEHSPVRQVRHPVLSASPPVQYSRTTPPARPSLETMGSAGSNGGQAVLETDAWLPYQRVKAGSELNRVLAELSLSEEQGTPSTERSSPDTVKLATESSKSSGSQGGSLDKEQSLPSASRTSRLDARMQPSKPNRSSPTGAQKNLQPAFSLMREDARIVLRSESPPPKEGQPRRTTVSGPHYAPRTQPPLPTYNQRWSPESSHPKRPATSNSRAQNLVSGLSSPARKPAPQASTRPPQPPSFPTVNYETVEGVNLKTRPRSAKGNRAGLSIPEIEARDIQKIPDWAHESQDDIGDQFIRQYRYARTPPPIGSSHDYVRTISPRPVEDGQDHILFDRYSRAADDEMPDQRAEVPSRFRLSLVAPFAKHDPPQPQEDEESDDDEDTAEPPSIARTRAIEAQDQEMTSRTNQAKNLISGMLKGLTGRKDNNQTKNGTAVS